MAWGQFNKTAKKEFPARKASTYVLDFESFQDAVPSASLQVEMEISPNAEFEQQTLEQRQGNFMIAHSMGGIVGRHLDQRYNELANPDERGFYGLVTFGSPHQGARIVNNALQANGEPTPIVEQFFNDACLGMTAGYTQELGAQINSIPIVGWFVDGQGIVSGLTDELCGLISERLPQYAFKGFIQPIVQDIKVGSDIIGELNSNPSSIKKVAFYGLEDDETMFWRTMHYLINKPNFEDYFDAVHDDRGVAWRDMNFLDAVARRDAWSTAWLLSLDPATSGMIQAGCINQGLPGNCLALCNDDYSHIMDGWGDAIEWWETANDQYRVIIGALEPADVPVPIGSPECWCAIVNADGDTGTGWHYFPSSGTNCVDGPTDPNTGLHRDCEWRQEYVLAPGYIEKRADGIVLEESASDYPSGGGPAAYPVRMEGSNHQQMRNDQNTKKGLFNLYEGTYEGFFATEPK